MAGNMTIKGDTFFGKGAISAFELFKIQTKRAILRKEYLDHWQSTRALTSTGRPVDAIITPAAPFPPPPHGQYKWDWLLPLCAEVLLTFPTGSQSTRTSGMHWITQLASSRLLR